MITSKRFRFIIAKIYNILRWVIPYKLRHMCNLHIKETEISQKRSKGIKNWKITYSVILSVLLNKTNLILGFSSPLMYQLKTNTYLRPVGECLAIFLRIRAAVRRTDFVNGDSCSVYITQERITSLMSKMKVFLKC